MIRRLSYALAALAVWAVMLPVAAVADPVYFPLDLGLTWSYEASGGEHETKTVLGSQQLFGETVQVIGYSESGSNDVLQNYWTLGSDGDVFLWGFFRYENGGWGVAYNPPICFVDAPALLGKAWACTTTVYELPGEIPQYQGVFEYEFAWEGTLTVPAGEFESVGVAPSPLGSSALSRHGYTVDGRVLNRDAEPERWYSDGVGEVQYESNSLFQLTSFGVSPVETLSWARIKLLYR